MKIDLFNGEEQCCACGACYNICPQNAIEMVEKENGFIYPNVKENKCINCGLCKKACLYTNKEVRFYNDNKKVWIAVNQEQKTLKKSSSGGAFAVFAKKIINEGGVVYGSALIRNSNNIDVKHIRIDKNEGICLLQGSKYVQSRIEQNFKLVKKDLLEGRKVLFSGTPCQIAGLNGFLLGKKFDNLITIDIVCHGVPSLKMFQDFIAGLEKRYNASIINFSFRDKEKGWGLNAKILYEKNGKECNKIIDSALLPYYKLFLDSDIYRKNCYSCPYACKNRPADITLGDFWGIEKEHPECLAQNGGDIDTKKGVSCIISNSSKGNELVENCKENFLLRESTFEKAANGNAQLRGPSRYRKEREEYISEYEKNGYQAVEKLYKKNQGFKYYIKLLWGHTPRKIKRLINKARK